VQLAGDVPGLIQQLRCEATQDFALVPLGIDFQDVDRAHAEFRKARAAAADADASARLAALLAALIERPAALVAGAGRCDQLQLRICAAQALVKAFCYRVSSHVLRQDREILRHRLETKQPRLGITRLPEQRRGAHVGAYIDDGADLVLRRQIL